MIGLARCWAQTGWADTARIGPSLGIFAGSAADREDFTDCSLFSLPQPRARPRKGWRAARTRSGLPVLLCGHIDNAAELALELGIAGPVPYRAPEQIYAAAFERWGEAADSHLVGDYATLIPLPDGRVRMARSPLGGYPLFYAADEAAMVACSIYRPIFAAGWPQQLRRDTLLGLLGMRYDDDAEGTPFVGVRQVPDGAVVHLSSSGTTTRHWYDLCALPEIRFRRDDDYVERARELIGESARAALRWADRPAMSLSGGLDSPIAAAEVLRQMPGESRLPAFTFHPLDEWRENVPPTSFADERGHVRDFAAMHPRLDVHFLDNRDVHFDSMARELFLAGSTAYPTMAIGATHHGVYQAAAAAGCDWLFSAADGNMTYSSSAPWAYPELFYTLRWGELWKLAAARAGDHRPIPRRIVAHAILPLLPQKLAAAIRALIHGPDRFASNELLRPDAPIPDQPMAAGFPETISRKDFLRKLKPQLGLGGESGHAYEQVFGIRTRDIAHYRPLIEFCLGLPTRQLVRNGQSRWLARRLGLGIMPEAQRLERRYAMQNADWHPRIARRLPDLRKAVLNMARQPELAPYVDVEKALAMIDAWPEEDPGAGPQADFYRFALPGTVLMSQYVDFMSGRNGG